MRILDKKSRRDNKRQLRLLSRKKLVLGVSVLFFLLAFQLGRVLQRDGIIHQTKGLLKDSKNIARRFVQGKIYGSNPEVLHLMIKFKDREKLEAQRIKALEVGLLTTKEYVPAKIELNGKQIPVNLRLKGDYTDHLDTDKWSFRVKVKKNKTLMGMKVFSLQHPKTRSYIWEYLYHKMLSKENIIALNYRFVRVDINGKDYGIYALEEHFEKRLLERNRRKEGPIIRFSETSLWDTRERFSNSEYDAYAQSEIDVFQTNDYLSDSFKNSQYQKGVTLLEGLRNRTFAPHEVLDIDLMAKFLAIADLFAAHHALIWHNLRFYYNPISSKLEPVGYDAASGDAFNGLHIAGEEIDADFLEFLYADQSFVSTYINYLEKFSEPSYLDAFYGGIAEELKQELSLLYNEFPAYQYNSQFLYNNQKGILSYLYPTRTLNAYAVSSNNNTLTLKLGNPTFLPVEVLSVTLGDGKTVLPLKKQVLEGKKKAYQTLDYTVCKIELPKDLVWNDTMFNQLKVSSRVVGTRKPNEVQVFPWNNFDEKNLQNDLLRKTTELSEIDYIEVDEQAKEIHFRKGAIALNKSLVIPEGYTVFVYGGTKLNFSHGAMLISHSSCEMVGEADNPIEFLSVDKTGQGLFVVGAKKSSLLKYVHFKNLSAPSKGGWSLSGAVTFYESNVTILNCSFLSNIRGDDYLNIVRSEAAISNSVFKNTKADALDVDFSRVTLSNCSFRVCGNDGVDTSGSHVVMKDVFLSQAKDKALSSGESSYVTAENLQIIDSEIAICSKDLSRIELTSLRLENNTIGFTAFQKKPEFGGAEIECFELTSISNEVPYLIEEGSVLSVDGESKRSQMSKVKEILYGVKYGKPSK